MRQQPLSVSRTPRTGLLYPDVQQYLSDATVRGASRQIAAAADNQINLVIGSALRVPNRSAALAQALVSTYCESNNEVLTRCW